MTSTTDLPVHNDIITWFHNNSHYRVGVIELKRAPTGNQKYPKRLGGIDLKGAPTGNQKYNKRKNH